jgi:UTP:GlnB (protein PII) uridylyltransferase
MTTVLDASGTQAQRTRRMAMSSLAYRPVGPILVRQDGVVGETLPAGGRPAATSGSMLRLLAARLGRAEGRAQLARLHALVKAGQAAVVGRFADGDPGTDLSTAYTRLADSAVVHLMRRMRATAEMAAAPVTLTVVAISRYGAREALPGDRLELLFLVPDEARSRAAAEAATAQLTADLRVLGFDVRGRTTTLGEQVASELTGRALSERGAQGRFIAGSYGLLAELRARLEEARRMSMRAGLPLGTEPQQL